MTKRPLPQKQSPVARYALKHPNRVALGAAAILAGWTSVIVGDWRAVLGCGLGALFLFRLMWAKFSPFRKREIRFYDESGNLRSG